MQPDTTTTTAMDELWRQVRSEIADAAAMEDEERLDAALSARTALQVLDNYLRNRPTLLG